MIVLNGIFERNFNFNFKTVITVGNFDGVHAGHRFLLKKTSELAKKLNAKLLVFSFWPNTKKILFDNKFKSIFDRYERRLILKNLAIDYLFEFNFDCEKKNIKSRDFLAILIKEFNCVGLVLGEDFKFGCDDSKKILCEYKNLNVIVIKKKLNVSSSKIRNLILEKRFDVAKKLMCENYFIYKKNVKIVGRRIIFLADENKLLPPNGIYKTKILIDGKIFDAVTEIIEKGKICVEVFCCNLDKKFDFVKVIF